MSFYNIKTLLEVTTLVIPLILLRLRRSGNMATLLPPPTKRQKVQTAQKAQQQQDVQTVPDSLGSVRVQFFDQATGLATGPAVSVPVADATVKNLETLLNTLQGNVCTLAVHSIRPGLICPGRRRASAIPVHIPIGQ